MPTFIPAHGHTLHVAGVCINRIGRELPFENHFEIANDELFKVLLQHKLIGSSTFQVDLRMSGSGAASR